jgi:hypothetical protein
VYLKRQSLRDAYRYVLCESYRDDGCWKHRELMDLGPDPATYIEYFGGNSFHFKEEVEQTLLDKGVKYSSADLEEVFMPFLDPEIRRIVEMFDRSGTRKSRWRACSPEELMKYHRELHPFDRRRLHYLRCGQVNPGDLEGRPWKFLNVLLEKSRDEIEHVIKGMEQVLRPYKVRRYLYTALNLEAHFRHLLTHHQPEMLDARRVDQYFLQEICRLNDDETFFQGVERSDSTALHPYLVKYVILYFDNAFDPGLVWDERIQDFRWRYQFYRPPPSSAGSTMDEERACQVLGITAEKFFRMDRHELARCYKKFAKKAHPDMGGDKEAFVEIKEAYECLLRRKC